MSTAILLALHLVAVQTQIDVSTPHEILELDGKPYFLLAKGTRLEANMLRESSNGQVWIDVARVGLQSDNRAGLGRMSVTMGTQTSTVRVRAPLVPELPIGADRIGSKIKSTSLVVLEKETKLTLEASAEDSDLLVSIAFGGMSQDDQTVFRAPAWTGAAAVTAAAPDDAGSSSSAGAGDANAPSIQSVRALRIGESGTPLKLVVEAQDASGNVVALIARFLDANGNSVAEAVVPAPATAPAPAVTPEAAHQEEPAAAAPETATEPAAPAAGPETATEPAAPAAAPETAAAPDAAAGADSAIASSESSTPAALPMSDRYFFDFPVYGQTRFVAERTFPQFFAKWGDRVVQVEVQLEDETGRRSAAVRATFEVVAAPSQAKAVASAPPASFLQRTLGLPIALSAQVAAGGAFQLSGGLQPVVLQGGFRVGARWLEQGFQKYALALAVDALQQAASTKSTVRPAVRWSSGETRLRLEASADVGRYDIAGLDVGATVAAGLGVTMGNHYVVAAGKTTALPLLGPTARVAVMADTQLGPGALTLALPLDVAVDMAGGVSGYGPIALGLTAGYRFDF